MDAVSIFDPLTKSSTMTVSRAKSEDEIRDEIPPLAPYLKGQRAFLKRMDIL